MKLTKFLNYMVEYEIKDGKFIYQFKERNPEQFKGAKLLIEMKNGKLILGISQEIKLPKTAKKPRIVNKKDNKIKIGYEYLDIRTFGDEIKNINEKYREKNFYILRNAKNFDITNKPKFLIEPNFLVFGL